MGERSYGYMGISRHDERDGKWVCVVGKTEALEELKKDDPSGPF